MSNPRPVLYRNGRLYSNAVLDPTALLVENGVITWIGDESGADGQVGAETVDLACAFITPAFVDAHVHTTGTGLALSGLDLSNLPSLADALALVERAARASRGRPLLGSGWDETSWPEQRPPTAAELDRASYGGSVYLARIDAHSAVISSSLRVAVPGLADLAGYRGDGWVSGEAHDRARTTALSALTAGQTADLQRIALQHAAANGIACVHEMAGPAISSQTDLATLTALAHAEPLPEVIAYWGELLAIETAQSLGAVGAAGDLFCDGSLGSHTAALREPYNDDPMSSGELRFATQDMAEHMLQCVAAGLQFGFHAIGDAAIDQVLDACEAASVRLGRPAGAGSRIEHVEFVQDSRRLAASGLMASMQPAFDATWGGASGMYSARLGTSRATSLNQFSALASAGVPMAFGSDSPVTPLDPWGGIRAAVYPQVAASGISVRAAFAAHTRGGWRIARRESEGILAVGLNATFAAWDAAELAVDAPDDRVSRWSTDPRAAVPGLPDVSPGVELPSCMRTVLRGKTLFDATG